MKQSLLQIAIWYLIQVQELQIEKDNYEENYLLYSYLKGPVANIKLITVADAAIGLMGIIDGAAGFSSGCTIEAELLT